MKYIVVKEETINHDRLSFETLRQTWYNKKSDITTFLDPIGFFIVIRELILLIIRRVS